MTTFHLAFPIIFLPSTNKSKGGEGKIRINWHELGSGAERGNISEGLDK